VTTKVGRDGQIAASLGGDLGRILVLDFKNHLQSVNDRLKLGRLGCTIEVAGDRLVLRATLPPKPGREGRASQQRIYTGMKANPRGLKAAEAQAKRLGGELADKSFDWRDWGWEPEIEALTIEEWIARFEADWWRRKPRSTKASATLESGYLRHFRRLPQNERLTEAVLVGTIERLTRPDTRTRKAFCLAYGKLAALAGLKIDLGPLKGNYSPQRVGPRDLPDDATIVVTRDGIADPWWQWAYGMMACYGLRNHEIFHLEFDGEKIRIGENAKTGYRVVRPLYPEWFGAWKLHDIPPAKFGADRLAESSNIQYGMWINRGFKRRGIEQPYNLRHCYARRCRDFLIPVTLAARMMGHSVAVHEQTYSRWITEGDDDRLIEALTGRQDRPAAPDIETQSD
jgi:integrase